MSLRLLAPVFVATLLVASCGGQSPEEQAADERAPTLSANIVTVSDDPAAQAFLRDLVALRSAIDVADTNATSALYVTIEHALEADEKEGRELLAQELPDLAVRAADDADGALAQLELIQPETDYGRQLQDVQRTLLRSNVESFRALQDRISSGEDEWRVIADWGELNNKNVERLASQMEELLAALPPALKEAFDKGGQVAGYEPIPPLTEETGG